MCIVNRSLQCAGFDTFRTSCLCCVRVLKNLAGECLTLKPCSEGDRGCQG